MTEPFDSRVAPSFAPTLKSDVWHACRAIAADPSAKWVSEAETTWPGPMAHEYHRLRRVLEDGQVVSAIFQLKDFAEVCIRFPALVLASDILRHGRRADGDRVRRALDARPFGMGQWLQLLRDVLAPVARSTDKGLVFPELADVFLTRATARRAPTLTPWARLLEALCQWRNESLAHGPFRLDVSEYLPEVARHVQAINVAVQAQVLEGTWAHAGLQPDDESINILRGWQSIERHHALDAHRHGVEEVRLRLTREDASLDLWPLIALWRCPQCRSRDVFMYDGRHGRSATRAARMIDFLAGHSLTVAPHHLTELTGDAVAAALPEAVPDGELVVDFTQLEIEGQLEQLALQARYIEPTFLRETCVSFLEAHDSGILWLRGSEGVGKSVFVANLVAERTTDVVRLPPDVAVAALHLRRGRTGWVRQLREFLEWEVLRRALGVGARAKDTPRLDIDAEEPRVEFARVLSESLAIAPRPKRLLICIDGLDELWAASENEGNLAAFLPFASELPSGCYLLLTSRPLSESPAVVQRYMSRHPIADPGYLLMDVDADAGPAGARGATSAYLTLLREYFDRDVRVRVEGELHHALLRCANHASTRWHDDLASFPDRAWARTARDMWTSLTTRTDAEVTMPRAALSRSLKAEVLQPLLARVDTLFQLVLEKSRGRFAYLAHLTRILASRGLSADMLADFPVGDGMNGYFLDQLQLVLADAPREGEEVSSKRWDFTRRLLLMLVAAEEVYARQELDVSSPWPEQGFRGISLGALADLLGEPSGSSLRLLFTLSALKDVMSIWKGDGSRLSSIALGLPGLAAAARARWTEELIGVHRAIAAETLDRLAAWNAEAVGVDEAMSRRVEHVLHHASLSGDSVLLERALASEVLARALRSLAHGAQLAVDHRRAHALASLAMQMAEEAALTEETTPALLEVASTHRVLVRTLTDAGWLHLAASHAHRAATVGARAKERSPDDWIVRHFASVDNLNFARTLIALGDLANAAALVEVEQEVVGRELGMALRGTSRNPGEGLSEEGGADWPWIQQTVELLADVHEVQGEVAAANGNHREAAEAFQKANALLLDLLHERHTPEQAYEFIQSQQRLRGFRLLQLRQLDDDEARQEAEALQAVLASNDESLSALPLPPDDLLRLLERRFNDCNDAYRSGNLRTAETGYTDILERLGSAADSADAASSFRGAILRGEVHRARALALERRSIVESVDMSEAILADLQLAIGVLGPLAEQTVGVQGTEPRVIETLARAHMNLAATLTSVSRLEEAVSAYERATNGWNRLLRMQARGELLEVYRQLGHSETECALVLIGLGKTARALELLSRAAEHYNHMMTVAGSPLSDEEEYSLIVHAMVVAVYTQEAGDTDTAVRRFQAVSEHASRLVSRGVYKATEEWLDGEAWALVALTKAERWSEVPAALWRTAEVLEGLIRTHPSDQPITETPWFEQAHGLPNVVVQLEPAVREYVKSQFDDEAWMRVLRALFFATAVLRAASPDPGGAKEGGITGVDK